jgi:hypothetical protein
VQHSTRKPTKAEQAHLDRIHALPCCACAIEQVSQPSRTEANHLVDKGYRIHSGGHMATVPLCGWHHRGELLYPHTSREMHFLYGPSMARSPGEFKARYGSQRKLLGLTNRRLYPGAHDVSDLPEDQEQHVRSI